MYDAGISKSCGDIALVIFVQWDSMGRERLIATPLDV